MIKQTTTINIIGKAKLRSALQKYIFYNNYVGLPYLEKQKSGQWMATSHDIKYMGLSFFLIKIGTLKFNANRTSTTISAENDTKRAAKQVMTFFFFGDQPPSSAD